MDKVSNITVTVKGKEITLETLLGISNFIGANNTTTIVFNTGYSALEPNKIEFSYDAESNVLTIIIFNV